MRLRLRFILSIATLLAVFHTAIFVSAQTLPAKPAGLDQLKALLPKSFMSQGRRHLLGDTIKSGDQILPVAYAEYAAGDKVIDHGQIDISDFAASPERAANLPKDIGVGTDSSDEDQTIKTLKVNGYTAVETVHSYNHQVSIKVIIGNRFLLTFNFLPTDAETLFKAISAFDYKSLEALAH